MYVVYFIFLYLVGWGGWGVVSMLIMDAKIHPDKMDLVVRK